MRRLVSSAVLAVLLSFCAILGQAQYSGYPGGYHPRIRSEEQTSAEQRRLVSAYCRADFDGARLNAGGEARFKDLLSFRLSPELSSFAVVSRFDLPGDAPKPNVTITYHMLGRWESSMGYQRVSDPEETVFHIVQRDGELRIDSVEPSEPRVSVRAALEYLRGQLSDAKEETRRAMLDAAIKELTALQRTGNEPNAATSQR